MYYKDRPQAGRLLADKLSKYSRNKCVVLALTPGGVLVGVQIAMRLHCHLMLLLTEKIILPGEIDPIGALTTDSFSYAENLSSEDIIEINSEFHNVIDAQRMTKQHVLNRLITAETKITPSDLKDKIVIVVSDGFTETLPLDVLEDFLKPIRTKKIVIATPLTNVKALDKMHLLGDELAVLDVREDIISVNHHYEDNNIPNFKNIVKIIRNTA